MIWFSKEVPTAFTNFLFLLQNESCDSENKMFLLIQQFEHANFAIVLIEGETAIQFSCQLPRYKNCNHRKKGL
jgi:hypothetical protein